MNTEIYLVIRDVCWERVQDSPEFKELLRLHNRCVDRIAEKLGPSAVTDVENSIFAGANVFGRAMFELGLELGRNPESILELPERQYPS